MKIYYLVQAHTNPSQLKRMISQLTDDQVFFLIHIDSKTSIDIFKEISYKKNIHFIENRVNCIWGDFSQVQATLNLIQNLKLFPVQPEDRIVLISGQDYPLKNAKEITKFYSENISKDFIEFFVAKEKHYRPYLNFKGYKVNRSDKRGDYVIFKKHNFTGIYKSLLKRCFKFKYLKYFFTEKKLNPSITFYKGSQWWSLRYDTLQKIVDLYNSNYDEFYNFFKVSFCSDEYFFQTLLVQVMKDDIDIKVESLLTYIDWDRTNVPLPVTFTIEDKEFLKTASDNFLYARKFDTTKDKEILDWIDLKLLK
ncbi:glycosyl transferase family 14 [Myroides odoratimimus]|uniref:Peptide O-xylosyltransferase n=3 Tax=Myroides odoratimimus TaxID=76832 RepID=A0A0S7E8Q6_9FLAO|nr:MULTISPECIES: beta-1,6-N-acetylglucosaminyltransferase [Myroides]AJA69267.1 Core-2/I-Branching enzyme [Myroides sp. A21]ALU26493.1 glycosyl transferase family 14 [Myroides odoratimimus]APA92550.1 glycosyl transferase family 14 [Myroides sp. ZB35]EHO12017.1 hypothetical protein HMPREF9712_00264 [Myroides odoratimimus CCUG 10230]EHO13207.1 hypothetical protein HMPREF9714_01041 [Myroides odoratimimus CCUG 12901]